tara:strand:+ start:263 stop:505 length:243 start_codon:yes stop_codon:yes gene_type:complete
MAEAHDHDHAKGKTETAKKKGEGKVSVATPSAGAIALTIAGRSVLILGLIAVSFLLMRVIRLEMKKRGPVPNEDVENYFI